MASPDPAAEMPNAGPPNVGRPNVGIVGATGLVGA